ncbi:hypothetical protein R83H12_01370 [Fibrobacteria bacterium R8-3-H12]
MNIENITFLYYLNAAKIALLAFGFHTAFAECTSNLFAGGDGTEANPYQISTPQELQNLNECNGESYENNYYVLNNDIDLTEYLADDEEGWQPISNSSFGSSFYGKFNGNGHKVSGLWINRPDFNWVGLFGYIRNGAMIENLGVEIDDSKDGVLGNGAGGLVGVSDGTISNSYAIGNVTANTNSSCGGLVGNNNGGTINNSYATGNVTGTYNVGGLVGYNSYGSIIINSYATGSVSGSGNVGGLVGNNNGTVSNCYATGNVKNSSNSGDGTGGLVGFNSGSIINCYATGDVTDTRSGGTRGGLVGLNTSGSYCAELGAEVCQLIDGEAIESCSLRTACIINGISIGNMLINDCFGMGGTVPIHPLATGNLPRTAFRAWQTMSGAVNVDLGYMPTEPITVKVYNLQGRLVASEQVNARVATIRFNAASGIYVFKAGNRAVARMVK